MHPLRISLIKRPGKHMSAMVMHLSLLLGQDFKESVLPVLHQMSHAFVYKCAKAARYANMRKSVLSAAHLQGCIATAESACKLIYQRCGSSQICTLEYCRPYGH